MYLSTQISQLLGRFSSVYFVCFLFMCTFKPCCELLLKSQSGHWNITSCFLDASRLSTLVFKALFSSSCFANLILIFSNSFWKKMSKNFFRNQFVNFLQLIFTYFFSSASNFLSMFFSFQHYSFNSICLQSSLFSHNFYSLHSWVSCLYASWKFTCSEIYVILKSLSLNLNFFFF